MKLPAYQCTKPSGVEWLGDVPEHWEVKRLRHVLSRNDGGVWGEEDDPDGTVVLRSTEQTVDGSWQISDPAKRNLTPKEKSVTLLKAGDLVVTKSSGSALHIGKTSFVSKEVEALQPCYSNFMQRLRVESGYDPRLVFYVLNSPTGRQQLVFNSNTTTGLANLNAGILGDVFISTPPPAEQRSIAAYLDRETGRVDQLVAKKRELIERLKEKRTAVISRTVTRGLPPGAARAAGLPANPPLKPSALDWLGDIPAHWVVLPLRRSIQFLTDYEANGSFADTKENVTIDSGEPFAWYVRATDLENKRVGLVEGNRYCDEATYRWLSKTALEGGELLVAKRGEIGKVYVMPIVAWSATLAPNLYLIRLNRRLLPRFAWYWFSVDPGNAELVLADKSTTIGALYKDDVKACFVLMPPFPEQAVIAAYLDEETAKLDALVGKVEEAVERLQEYRTALITAAVTGKIDVRKSATKD